MVAVRIYHRPGTLEAALELLAREGVLTAVLAGGTHLNGRPATVPEEVVDLQALDLNGISLDGDRLAIGATVRLQDLAEYAATPPIVTEAVLREGPNTLRNAATVGGVVAVADRESELLASLIVHDAAVALTDSDGSTRLPLPVVLGDGVARGSLITGVDIEVGGSGSIARTGRTPSDRSIVAAVGRRGPDGGVRLALTGVAPVPIGVEPAEIDDLDPQGDFRGSGEYRRDLARVLTGRVLAELS